MGLALVDNHATNSINLFHKGYTNKGDKIESDPLIWPVSNPYNSTHNKCGLVEGHKNQPTLNRLS